MCPLGFVCEALGSASFPGEASTVFGVREQSVSGLEGGLSSQDKGGSLKAGEGPGGTQSKSPTRFARSPLFPSVFLFHVSSSIFLASYHA